MTNPYQNTATAKLITDSIRDLSHRKTQAEIASEAGFANANMMTHLKIGKNKVPLDRVPSLAKALEVDPAFLMRLALDQSVGATAAKAIIDIFGTPTTENERGWTIISAGPNAICRRGAMCISGPMASTSAREWTRIANVCW